MIAFSQGDYHFINKKETFEFKRYWNIAHVETANIGLDVLKSILSINNVSIVMDDEAAKEMGYDVSCQISKGDPGRTGVILLAPHFTAVAYSADLYKAYAKEFNSHGVIRYPGSYSDAFIVVIDESLKDLDYEYPGFVARPENILPENHYSTGVSRRFQALPNLGVVPMLNGCISSSTASLGDTPIDADYLIYKGSRLMAAYGLHYIKNFCLPAPAIWNDNELNYIAMMLASGKSISVDSIQESDNRGFYYTTDMREALTTWIESTRQHKWVDLSSHFRFGIPAASSGWTHECEIKSAILPDDMTEEAWQQVKSYLVSEETLSTCIATGDYKSLRAINEGVGADLILVDDDFAAILAEFQAKYDEYRAKIFRATLDQLAMMASDVCSQIKSRMTTVAMSYMASGAPDKNYPGSKNILGLNQKLVSEVNTRARGRGMDMDPNVDATAALIYFEESIFGTYASPKNVFGFVRSAIPWLNISDAQTIDAMKEEIVRKAPYYIDATKKTSDGRLMYMDKDNYLLRSNPSHRSGLIFKIGATEDEKKALKAKSIVHLVDRAGQRIFVVGDAVIYDSWDGLFTGTAKGNPESGYDLTFNINVDLKAIKPRSTKHGADGTSDWVAIDAQDNINSAWSSYSFNGNLNYADFATDPLNQHLADDIMHRVGKLLEDAMEGVMFAARDMLLGSGVDGMNDACHDLDKKKYRAFLWKKLDTYSARTDQVAIGGVTIGVTGRCSICVDFGCEVHFIRRFRPKGAGQSKIESDNAAVLRRMADVMSSGSLLYVDRAGIQKNIHRPCVINNGSSGIKKKWGPAIVGLLGAATLVGTGAYAAIAAASATLVVNPIIVGVGLAVSFVLLAVSFIWSLCAKNSWNEAPATYATIRFTANDLSTDITSLIQTAATMDLRVLDADAIEYINLVAASGAEMAYRAVRPLLDSIKKQGANESMICWVDGSYMTTETMFRIGHVNVEYAQAIMRLVSTLKESMGNDSTVTETLNRFTKFAIAVGDLIAASSTKEPVYYLEESNSMPTNYIEDKRALGAALMCMDQ